MVDRPSNSAPGHELEVRAVELQTSVSGDVDAMLSENLGDEGAAGQLEVRGVRLTLGTRPLVYDVRHLHALAGVEVSSLKLFRVYEPWLVVHHVGIIAEQGAPRELAVRYEADFGEVPACTVGLVPDLVLESRQLGDLSFHSQIDVTGRVTAGEVLPGEGTPLGLGGGLQAILGSRVSLEGAFALCKRTIPRVHAAGYGTPRREWYFQANDEPLVATQSMAQLVLVPRGTRDVALRLRGELVLARSLCGFQVSRTTGWTVAETLRGH